MVKPDSFFSNIKTWSNFRLMLVLGSVVTMLSLVLGGVVVQAALSDGDETGNPSTAGTEVGPTSAAPEPGPASGGNNPTNTQGSGTRPLNLADGTDFRISCPAAEPTSNQNTCQVESFSGFADPVQLSCSGLPANLACTFTPSSVTPRTNGSTPFKLELQATNVAPGSYVFDVVGRSGDTTRTYRYPWGVAAPRVASVQPTFIPPAAPGAAATPAAEPEPVEPTFSFTCGSLSDGGKVAWPVAQKGSNVTINCFLTPLNGFDEDVTFEFKETGDLAKPTTISFLLDQLKPKKLFDLRFELSDEVLAELEESEESIDHEFEVVGTSESGKSLARKVTLTLTP